VKPPNQMVATKKTFQK